jgi:hypothetical protein
MSKVAEATRPIWFNKGINISTFLLGLLTLLALSFFNNFAYAIKPAQAPFLSACIGFEPHTSKITVEGLQTIDSTLSYLRKEKEATISMVTISNLYVAAREPTDEEKGEYWSSVDLAMRRQEQIRQAILKSEQATPSAYWSTSSVNFHLEKVNRPPYGGCYAGIYVRFPFGKGPSKCGTSDGCYIECQGSACK